jgi:hypothetical protein
VSAEGSGAKFEFPEDLFKRLPRRVPFQRFRAISFILPADYAHVWSSRHSKKWLNTPSNLSFAWLPLSITLVDALKAQYPRRINSM